MAKRNSAEVRESKPKRSPRRKQTQPPQEPTSRGGTSRRIEPHLEPPQVEAQTWDERLLPALMPYWREIVGAALLLFSIFNLLALPGLTQSGLLGYVTQLSKQLLGWGAWILFLSIGVLGVRMMVYQLGIARRYSGRTVAGIELLFFLGLPLTHYVQRATFDDAWLGRAGGLLGWALADPPLRFFGPVLTILLYMGLFAWAIAFLRGWTLSDAVRALIWVSGRLRTWSEQLQSDPDEGPMRTVHADAVVPRRRGQRRGVRSAAAQYAEPPPGPYRAPEPPTLTIKPARLRPILGRSQHRVQPPLRPMLPDLPPLELLNTSTRETITPEQIHHRTKIIEQTLFDFGLEGKVIEVRSGPALTQFGIEPGYIVRHDASGEVIRNQKVRVSQIANLRNDFALALAVPRLRIEAPVPGRGIVGIEVPNPQASMVRLRDGLESPAYRALRKPMAVALGEDVAGNARAINLAKMPHLLIAGTTGSGKSVCMKALITSLIMNNTPETLRMVMVDPKRVEMIRFNGLPHLFGPAEVEGERIIGVLRWVVAEMDRRYAAFSELNARQLESYNRKVMARGERPMPYIAVFIDELADLMVQYGAETERTLCRLAQMARATGIHLVVATQRPSTDIITGLIKANFPARIAFSVASSTDSRVVLDATGADQLLGNGDMLFLGSDASTPVRVQGCFVDDDEIDRIVEFWQARYPEAENRPPPWQSLLARMKVIDDTDDEIEQAIALVQKYDNISTSLLQRRMRIGFPRAARLMETLFEMGLVEDPKKGGKTRKTYVSEADEDPLGKFIGEKRHEA